MNTWTETRFLRLFNIVPLTFMIHQFPIHPALPACRVLFKKTTTYFDPFRKKTWEVSRFLLFDLLPEEPAEPAGQGRPDGRFKGGVDTAHNLTYIAAGVNFLNTYFIGLVTMPGDGNGDDD